MNQITICAALFAACGVTACGLTSYGRRVDAAAIDRVEVCKTSKADALKTLGAPYKTGSVGDLDLLTYEYGGADGTDRLQVAVDKQGIVVDKAHNADFSYQSQNRCAGK
jgi:hypothetical protein